MKLFKIIITFSLVLSNCNPRVIPSQKEKDLVTLAEIYHKYHNTADITQKEKQILNDFKGHELEFISSLLKEICSNKGNPFINKFVSKPDSMNLKYFYTLHAINIRMFDSADIDTLGVSVNVFRNDFNYFEALSSYYRSIFSTLINKHDQKNLPAINFNLDELNFENNIEKSIFFFQMIGRFQVPVLMTINMQKDYNSAFKLLNSIPKINSTNYYNYNNFLFDDVTLTIFKKQRRLKEYYMPQYYGLLVGHLTCLINLDKSKDEINDLLNNSILCMNEYYKYFKNKKLLESIKSMSNK